MYPACGDANFLWQKPRRMALSCKMVLLIESEGEAFAWHQWEDTRRPFWSWEDFKRLLLERFGPGDEEEMSKRFFSLW